MEVQFNEPHYSKVYHKRKLLNLPLFSDLYPESGRIFGHEMEGKKILDDDQEYTIQSVHKHWYHGWYYIFVVYKYYKLHENSPFEFEMINGEKCGKSHGTRYWKNISCVNDIILTSIKESEENLIFL